MRERAAVAAAAGARIEVADAMLPLSIYAQNDYLPVASRIFTTRLPDFILPNVRVVSHRGKFISMPPDIRLMLAFGHASIRLIITASRHLRLGHSVSLIFMIEALISTRRSARRHFP